MMADMNTRMPALYIGHGAPPLLDDPLWSSQLVALAGDLPRPKAILIVSAHWESAPVSLSATGPGVGLVYDFGGFAEK
jgi:4,5-DOPA dioxygenase extradiol